VSTASTSSMLQARLARITDGKFDKVCCKWITCFCGTREDGYCIKATNPISPGISCCIFCPTCVTSQFPVSKSEKRKKIVQEIIRPKKQLRRANGKKQMGIRSASLKRGCVTPFHAIVETREKTTMPPISLPLSPFPS